MPGISTGWHLAHLMVLSAWGGLVAAESVLEVMGRRPEFAPVVARCHFWIDMLVELPLLAGVALTGGVLLTGVPFEGAMIAKVLTGSGAVAANLACLVLVVLRYRRAPAGVSPTTRWIFRSAIVGMPLALIALYLGAQGAGWFGYGP